MTRTQRLLTAVIAALLLAALAIACGRCAGRVKPGWTSDPAPRHFNPED